MLRGFTRNFKPLDILAEEQVKTIHRGTLDVLQETGIRVEHERALKLFADYGCQADFDKNMVRIPGWLVEDCLHKCPSSFLVKARDPKNDVRLGGSTLYFENSIGMNTVDLDTWEPRAATMSEHQDGVKALDALDSLHLVNAYTPYSQIDRIPPCMTMVESFASRIRNSAKCQAAGHSNDSEMFTIRMGKIAETDLLGTVVASSPLTYYADAAQAMLRFVQAGFPITIGSGALMGASAPATVAGATVTNNAELIAGIVLAQLTMPGTGVLVSDSVYPMDMRREQPAFGGVGAALHNAIFNQVWRSYGIPTCSWIAGITSSKRIDFQCAYERAMTALLCALSGSSVISLHGAIYGELTWHPVQAVLDDDIAGWIGRCIQGTEVTDETLAINLIERVGPIPGQYLSEKHTRRWWKMEQFVPEAADRVPYPEWVEKGRNGALTLAAERLEEILATHEVSPLPPDQEKAIGEVLGEARRYYTQRDMM
jgi:trimethylamine--corrinoid protein Co-methyltransferase